MSDLKRKFDYSEIDDDQIQGESDKRKMDSVEFKGFGRGRAPENLPRASPSHFAPPTPSPAPTPAPTPIPTLSIPRLSSTSQGSSDQQAHRPIPTAQDILNFMTVNPFGTPTPTFNFTLPSAAALSTHSEGDWTTPKEYIKRERKTREHDTAYVAEVRKQEDERIKKNFIERASSSRSELDSDDRSTIIESRNEFVSQTTNLEAVSTVNPRLLQAEQVDDDETVAHLVNSYFNKPAIRNDRLPITKLEERIVSSVASHRVTIIEGTTGCGKTTQVPQFIADSCAQNGINLNIIVTQPRRIAASSIAARVAKERNWELGTLIGYQIGLDRNKVSQDTRLCYVTTGVLIQKLIHYKSLDQYSHIIIDEVHERSEETDLLMMIVKKFMTDNIGGKTKLILMSATFDVEKLQKYFQLPVSIDSNSLDEIEIKMMEPTLIRIEEKPHKIRDFYLNDIRNLCDSNVNRGFEQIIIPTMEKDNPDISPETYELATRLIIYFDRIDANANANKNRESTRENQILNTRGGVLVFLPGYHEIQEMRKVLHRHQPDANKWKVYPLHSSITHEEQIAVFQEPMRGERKIVLATNIAESSITVPDIDYIIDFCLTKSIVCDKDSSFSTLQTEWASKANCIQRAGRAGRVKDGRVYRLVDPSFYDGFIKFQLPELIRAPLEHAILKVKRLAYFGSPKQLLGQTLDPPNLQDIERAILNLKQVGGLSIMKCRGDANNDANNQWYYDSEDGELTVVGKIMAELPIDVRLSKLIIMGHAFDVLDDCITIAACLSHKGMFRRQFGNEMESYKSRFAWSDRTFSDCIAYMNAFKTFDSIQSSGHFGENRNSMVDWCKRNFLQLKKIKEIKILKDELTTRLRYNFIHVPPRPNLKRNSSEEELILKVAICAAFYPNYLVRQEIDVNEVNKMIATKDPFSTVVLSGLPQNQGIIYAKKIRELLSPCGELMDLDFDNTKVFVTFVDEGNPLERHQKLQEYIQSDDKRKRMKWRNTVIKTSVYLAVAMRNWRLLEDFHKYNKAVAYEKLQILNKVKMEKLSKNRMLNTSRIHVPMIYSDTKVKRAQLPSMELNEFPIYVTHIIDAGHFWAQYHNEQTEKALDKLSEVISYSHHAVPCDPDTIKLGDLVIAKWKDDYRRAQVIKVNRKDLSKEIDNVLVFFVDYGNSELYQNVRDLLEVNVNINPELIEIPAQAIECQLAFVKQSTLHCIDDNWSEEANREFQSYVEGKKQLIAKVFSVVNKIVRVEIFDASLPLEDSFSINNYLLLCGLAEKWHESQQSLLDHNARRRYIISGGRNQLNSIFFDQLDDDMTPSEPHDTSLMYYQDDVVQVSIEESEPSTSRTNIFDHEKIRLKGPNSPLESAFIGMTRQTYSQKCKVQRDSVNAVVLEPDYLSPHTRMLVASSISIQQTSQNIEARDTTLLPNIRGFPSLMTLLFTPKAEFRANKEGNQYIGAICGLGYDPTEKWHKGYDPANDIELRFDSEITLDDITKINLIRYSISDLFNNQETLHDYSGQSLVGKQKRIRKHLFDLLDRFRRFQRIDEYVSFKWGVQHPKLKTAKSPCRNTQMHILPVHNVVQINGYSYFETINKNINHIEAMRQREAKNFETTTCLLCNTKSYTQLELEHHVLSDDHKDEIENFHREYLAEQKRKQEGELKRKKEGESKVKNEENRNDKEREKINRRFKIEFGDDDY